MKDYMFKIILVAFLYYINLHKTHYTIISKFKFRNKCPFKLSFNYFQTGLLSQTYSEKHNVFLAKANSLSLAIESTTLPFFPELFILIPLVNLHDFILHIPL